MPAFPKLLEPIQIGGMRVKNRIAMAPMGTAFATTDGLFTDQAMAYYAARARGGAGLIIVENVGIDWHRHIHAANRPAIDTDLPLPRLTNLAKTIQKHGAKAIIQLNHSGRSSKSKFSGFQPVAASSMTFGSGSTPAGEIPRELGVEEIREVTDLFAQAAVRAKKAGFDGVEIHAAHGYLLAGFLSPYTNKRRDPYGGTLENRARILFEVIEEVRKCVGRDYIVGCRLNAREFGVEGGLTLEDSRAIAVKLSKWLDYLHLTVWGYGKESLVNSPEQPGGLLPYCEEIKKAVSIPVLAVGRLTPDAGEKAIRNGRADMIAVARGLLADPEIPNLLARGRADDIRPCTLCFHCLDEAYLKDVPLSCAVNAAAGREREYEIKPAGKSRKIAVVGAGPAGMEAARVLALRGHEVILFERESLLGGQMRVAMAAPFKKERIGPLLNYYGDQLDKLKVKINFNTEANPEGVGKVAPDAVILATGAKPVVPSIPGIDQPNVVTAVDILEGRIRTGERVLIIGGGSTGCETAEFLLDLGKKVTVAEMQAELANDMGFRDRLRLLMRIRALPINFMTNCKCNRINEGAAVLTTPDGQTRSIETDTIVLAVGMKQNNGLYPFLKAKGFETHMAGDCWRLEKIAGAIHAGLRLGCLL